MLLPCLFFTIALSVVNANVVIEFETLQGVGTGNTVERANASMGKVVHLRQNSILRYEMCIHTPLEMHINNIFYSNDIDNVTDVITFDIDGAQVGTFSTKQPSTDESWWTEFQESGRVGDPFLLDYGHHMLTIRVEQADSFGVELDSIELGFQNDAVKDLSCNLYCFDNPNLNTTSKLPNMDSFEVRQFSKASVCSEEENVKFGIYHNTARKFDIKATKPYYDTCSNKRDADFSGCNLASPAWSFRNVPLNTSRTLKKQRVSLAIDINDLNTTIAVTFDMSGFSITRGEGESRIAVALFVALQNVKGPIRTTLSYVGKSNRKETADDYIFTPEATTNTWILPVDIWGLDKDNVIIININTSLKSELYIQDIVLDKRPMETKTYKLFNNDKFVWEAIHRDPSWLSQLQKMHVYVRLPNGTETVEKDVENLRLYMKKPYDDGYAQIFVIHNDGHSRIQPVTSHGTDWTPFGTSMIIGPNNPNSLRPFALIKSITIDPIKLKLTVKYMDRTSLVLKIKPSAKETVVSIRQFKTDQDRNEFSLLTVLSTWIQHGYSNVDHIAVNNVELDGGIIGQWKSLTATKLNFYRKCISRLNTQSPDIEVTVVGKPEEDDD